MNNNTEIEIALQKLKNYIEKNDYKGYDPYDALKSPFFKLPVLKSNKLIRFGAQQLVKRSPLNLRSLLLVPKAFNPVTLGLSVQAYAYLLQAYPNNKKEYLKKIKFLIDELEKLIPKGFSGACWGYDFDWEARHAKIPAYQPTVVATGIITNALFIANKITANNKAVELIKSAANFVVKDLKRTYVEDTLCFSYSPFDKQQVFNASLKGARLLVQAYSLTKTESYKELAEKAIRFVINHQKEDGSWAYSLANKGGWTDNYHTGYVLDCIDEYIKITNDTGFNDNLKRAYNFYINSFITEEGAPKFYHNNPYPLDCTAASQTILTTIRFGDINLAEQVALFTINIMQKSNGSFRFRKFKNYIINTSFMRWSDAWMFAALSYLVKEL